MEKLIYLDNSATTKPFPQVVVAMRKYLEEEYANPSSLYKMAVNSEKAINMVRKDVATSLKAIPDEIVFTSGGTESNNIGIIGTFRAHFSRGKHLITTRIEHPSVLETYKYLEGEGAEISYLDVDREGKISFQQLQESIRDDTILVSIMHANNEIGSVQDLKSIGETIKKANPETLFHADGVQAYQRIPISVKECRLDLYSLSSHKVHGPKGVGALFIKKGIRFKPLLYGGGQEHGFRSGTENVPGIMGFGKAVEIFNENGHQYRDHLLQLKDTLAKKILYHISDCKVNGPPVQGGAPHILNVSFLGIRGEVLLHSLEGRGIMIGTGSACSSRKARISHVLKAIGLSGEDAAGAVRFSLSPLNTQEEIDTVTQNLIQCVEELRRFRRK